MDILKNNIDHYEDWKHKQITPSGETESYDAVEYFSGIVGYCRKVANDTNTSIPDRLKAMEVGAHAAFYQLQVQAMGGRDDA